MATAKKKVAAVTAPISVKYWLFAIVIALLPPINMIVIPLLALFSRDKSKRNFYLALMLYLLLSISLAIVAMVLIAGPEIFSQIWNHIQEFRDASGPSEDSGNEPPILVRPNRM